MNTFIQQLCIQMNSIDSKDINNVIKYICFELMLFFWTFYFSRIPEKAVFNNNK